MPNYVKVHLHASEAVIDALVGKDDEGKPWADFNRVIPQPINIEQGGCSNNHEPGIICWYEWNRISWGTKWNGVNTKRIAPDLLEFQTAWSAPLPVLVALSMHHPEARLEVKYADEDYGRNFDHIEIVDGKVAGLLPSMEDYGDEAREWAAQFWHGVSYAELYADEADPTEPQEAR